MNNPTFEFSLNNGTTFTTCDSKSESCRNGVKTTQKSRDGEVVLELDSNGMITRADFFAPDQSSCSDAVARDFPTCDLHATFTGSELAELISSNRPLQEVENEGRSKAFKQEQFGGQQSGSTGKTASNSNQLIDGIINTPVYLPIGALAVVLLLVLGRKHIVRLVSPSQSRQRPSQRQRSESVSFQSQGLNPIFNASLESSSELNRQLLPIIQKIDLLATRLDRLETELTVISQKSQPSVSFSSPPAQQTPRPTQPVITNSVPKPRPALDVDLIKLAVATSDYELIKPFAHDFVTETLESRQGMEDGLRFSIDGNQDQSDQRSQSEFIAIPYLDETYLIPNLLPNAADPARTIRRFVERNKLYRGSGDNLLSISVLATVDRSGDSYILRDSGRVG
jgi:hypothetical protein